MAALYIGWPGCCLPGAPGRSRAGLLALVLPVTICLSGSPFAVAVVGVFAYRILALLLPLPTSLAALPTLRRMGEHRLARGYRWLATVVIVTEIHAARRARAQQAIAEVEADAALITSPANVRYLSGLVSSNAAVLLPAAGPAVLATDSRYAETAERDCADLELKVERLVETALAGSRPGLAAGCWPSRRRT